MIIKSAIHRIQAPEGGLVPLILANNIDRMIHRGHTLILEPLVATLVRQGQLDSIIPPRKPRHRWRAAVVVQERTNSIFVIYQWRVPSRRKKSPNTSTDNITQPNQMKKVPTPNSPAKKARAAKAKPQPAKKPAPQPKSKSAAPKGKKRSVRNSGPGLPGIED